MLAADELRDSVAPVIELALAGRGIRLGVPRWTVVEDGDGVGGRPLTVNVARTLHPQAWADRNRTTRALWWHLAGVWRVPRLNRARITAVPLHVDRRQPQDVAACAPHVKAAIDGLVEAGMLADDDDAHLPVVVFTGPVVCGINGLALIVEDIG